MFCSLELLSIFTMAAIRHIGFSYFKNLAEIETSAYFQVDVQNLVKIGRSAADLLFLIFIVAAVRHLGFRFGMTS